MGIEIHIPEFKINICKRLSDQLLVHTAETVAVIIVLQWVEEVCGLIYKMLRRNHPKFDLTIISRICVRLIHRMNV